MCIRDRISTDDAYVTGNADPISAQVSGSVTVVNQKDTNYVRQGDILDVYKRQGIVSALYGREKSQRGAHVDIAMFDATLSFLEHGTQKATATKQAGHIFRHEREV